MKLPLQLPFHKKQKAEYFLALLLRDEGVRAVIFEEIEGKARVVGQHQEQFETTIEDSSAEEWLSTIDKTLSTAEETLPENIETQKTIFGVKETWVESTKIKKEYLSKLKHVSDELGLLPIGFIVIHEAIAHILEKDEGAPVSGILVEVGKELLTVSLIRAGKIVETKKAKIEDSIPQTTDRILQHFNYDVLPSRIIVFNGKQSEKLSQEFIAYSWSKSLPFLHVPQITLLPASFDAKAVLFGAATQMGFEILSERQPHHIQPQEEKDQQAEKEAKEESFGFLEDKDIAQNQEPYPQQIQIPQKEIHKDKPPFSFHLIFSPLLSLFQTVKNVFSKKSPPKKSFVPRIPKKIIVIPIMVIILFAAIFFFSLSSVKSTVTVTVKKETIEQTHDVSFVPSGDSDFSQNIIGVEYVSVTEEGSKSTQATGKKEIGDKAQGTVTIYSRLPQEKTFAQGTIITGPNDLQFTLDKEVKTASSSADASAQPSTVKVEVTAKQIGKESNLPSDTKLSFGSYEQAEVVAKNESAFSGGSKKEVTVIAKADIDKLTEEISKSLEDQAKKHLQEKEDDSVRILPFFTDTTIKSKEFDKKIDEEAKSVAIKASVQFQTARYKKDTLESFSKDKLKDAIKDKSLAKNGLSFETSDMKKNNDKIIGKIMIKAVILPKLDTKKLSEEIKGKSVQEAQESLVGLPQIEDASITLQPNIPFLPKNLPRFTDNITIIFKDE